MRLEHLLSGVLLVVVTFCLVWLFVLSVFFEAIGNELDSPLAQLVRAPH